MSALPLPEGTNALENVVRLRSLDANITGAVNAAGGLILPTKDTVGDPDDPAEGQVYVNKFSNIVRVYYNSAWHTLLEA